MPLDHERLDVYKLAIELIAWIGERLDGPLDGARLSAAKHLDAASQSIANNIAEGNGKRSRPDRCRFLDIARGSALECAACLDGLAARKRLAASDVVEGKRLLERIVAMLWRMIVALQGGPSTSTSTSTSTRG